MNKLSLIIVFSYIFLLIFLIFTEKDLKLIEFFLRGWLNLIEKGLRLIPAPFSGSEFVSNLFKLIY